MLKKMKMRMRKKKKKKKKKKIHYEEHEQSTFVKALSKLEEQLALNVSWI